MVLWEEMDREDVMFDKMASEIKCEVCGNDISFIFDKTVDDYIILSKVNAVNVYDSVDKIINKHLVYRCNLCGQLYRYTYKEIELMIRKKIVEKALTVLASTQIPSISRVFMDKYMIYCGKCTGIDGSGCCTKTIYEKCDIKRFPVYDS